jgi:gliding motility-associated-like protein
MDTVKVVTVNPLSIVPPLPAYCNGQSVGLSVSGGSTYTWSPATGLSASTGSSVIANPIITSTYTAYSLSNGCPDSGNIVVTVNQPPVVVITPSSPQICIGHPTTLNVSGASTYFWSPSTGLNQTTGSTVSAGPSVSTTYTAYGTDIHGCNDSAKVTINVNPLPIVTVAPTDSIVCNGLSVPLTAAGALTYEWSPSAGLNETTGSFVVASPLSTTTYSVYGTSSLGCTDTVATTINIIPNSIIVSLKPNSATICLGNSVDISASGGKNYAWAPSTALSTVNDSNVIVNPVSNITYTVVGIGTGGCSDTTFIPIIVSPPPAITVQPNAPIICNGQTISLTASGGASTYEWSPSTGLDETTGAQVDAHPTVTTTYTVIGTDSLNCIDSAKLTLAVDSAAANAFTTSAPSVCNPLQLQFSNATSGGISYLWNFGDGDSSTAQNPVHNYSKTGIYKITLISTSQNGCTDTLSVSDTLLNADAGVLTPNAFTPSVTGVNQLFKPIVQCTSPASYVFRVYDRWGMMLYQTNDPTDGWNGTYNGKPEPLDVYVYYIELNCGACSFFKKGNVTLLR